MQSRLNRVTFFKKFLKNPTGIGAIAPSSAQLTQSLLNQTDMQKHNVIVELGPGTGVFTKAILEHAKPDAKLICIEQDKNFSKQLQDQFPQVDVYTDTAENIKACLQKSNINKVCLIISGIPFAALPEQQQEALLKAIKEILGDGCIFQTFSYLHSPLTTKGRRFQNVLNRVFSSYKKSAVVWRNLPPAFWYTVEKS